MPAGLGPHLVFEGASRLRATSGLMKVPAGLEPHLIFDTRTKRKYFKGNLIDSTLKEILLIIFQELKENTLKETLLIVPLKEENFY